MPYPVKPQHPFNSSVALPPALLPQLSPIKSIQKNLQLNLSPIQGSNSHFL